MMTKIMVCFDGSDHAATALRHAAELARRFEATLEVVTVMHIDVNAIAIGDSAVMIPYEEDAARAAAADVLGLALTLVKDAGYPAPATHMLRGGPAEAILDHARSTGADLIVAGRRGYGTLRGMLVGSVSQKLIAHATCPVLIV